MGPCQWPLCTAPLVSPQNQHKDSDLAKVCFLGWETSSGELISINIGNTIHTYIYTHTQCTQCYSMLLNVQCSFRRGQPSDSMTSQKVLSGRAWGRPANLTPSLGTIIDHGCVSWSDPFKKAAFERAWGHVSGHSALHYWLPHRTRTTTVIWRKHVFWGGRQVVAS